MIIKPSKLKGKVQAIPAKSYAHRALICAALADKNSKIYFNKTSQDIDATISCLGALGADIKVTDFGVEVSPIKKTISPKLNVKESGSTFRFLLPISTTIYDECDFDGEGRLPERPISDLIEVMKLNGVEFEGEKLPFKTKGNLKSGEYSLRGDVSSQYVSGLLLAGAMLDKPSKIRLNTQLESKSYVDMTIEVMKNFGAEVIEANGYIVQPTGYKSCNYKVEGDWSNASFFLGAGALSDSIEVTGLNLNSKQGDRKILEILKEFGAIIKTDDGIKVSGNKLQGIEVDLQDIPDMLPILAVIATNAIGKSRFYNAKRLRLKESDRLKTTAEMITNLGGKVEEREDELIVYAKELVGGTVDSHNDHRIAMATTIASLVCKEEIILKDARAVEKSYPEFFEDFKSLGGQI